MSILNILLYILGYISVCIGISQLRSFHKTVLPTVCNRLAATMIPFFIPQIIASCCRMFDTTVGGSNGGADGFLDRLRE